MEQYRPELRVFVVDDQEVVRRGVRELVNAAGGLVVVGEASTRTSPGWIWSRRSARSAPAARCWTRKQRPSCSTGYGPHRHRRRPTRWPS